MTRLKKSPEQSARSSVYCASSPEVADDTGRYCSDRAGKEPNTVATPDLAAELLHCAEDWVAA